MNDTAEEVLQVSDGDADDGDDGTISPTPATVPKKRGRPVNSDKPKKSAATTGRGRGRPAKVIDGNLKKANKAALSADGSEEEGTGSDGGSPTINGDSAEAGTTVASKRGRKPKAKRKLVHPIESTGKGRGRPKKVAKTDDTTEDNEEAADDNDEEAVSDSKAVKKAKGAKKGRGRPKKTNSDDESSDDKEERRPVGRPSSGGINLNITRTGKGQGRPKKAVVAKRANETNKKSAESENGDGEKPKQRGRPPTSGKAAYSPTGKPRGRPKAVQDKDSQDDEDEVEDTEDNSKKAENSAEEAEDEKANSDNGDDF